MKRKLRAPRGKIRLKKVPTDKTYGFKSAEEARDEFKRLNLRMIELQELLYAEKKRSLLIVLQALDTGGKDGTIKHVMRGVNPQSCVVTSFKAPSELERSHDFLWRIHRAVPPRGYVGIFNRSHYEDVIVPYIQGTVKWKHLKDRYDRINEFEEHLWENGTHILKFYLHISKDEQKKRLQERLDDPQKTWKFSVNDLEMRKRWDDLMDAYASAFEHCDRDHAPWYLIPSNHKWFRNLAVASVIVDTLEEMKLKYPKSDVDVSKIKIV